MINPSLPKLKDPNQRTHDLENALNCIQFISELLNDGYQFNDHKAPERKKSFAHAVELVVREFYE